VKAAFIRLEGNFKRTAGFVLVGIDYRDIVLLRRHLSECLLNLDNKRKTSEQLLFALQKREQELHVAESRLKLEELEMAWQGGRTKKVVVEKEVLIGEMHHRVKNNMQIVISLAALAGADPMLADHDQKLFSSVKNRISRIAGIHEKFYATPWLSKINFGAFLKEIAMKVQSRSQSSGSPGFVVKAADEYLGVNQAIPCGIIAEELMVNAIRHAFPLPANQEVIRKNAYVVRVSFTIRKSMCHLSVCDNGIGTDYESAGNTPGCIGLKLISILVEDYLHGSMTVNKSFGSTFEVKFVASEI
jgi:two-component sensor histidine kinase